MAAPLGSVFDLAQTCDTFRAAMSATGEHRALTIDDQLDACAEVAQRHAEPPFVIADALLDTLLNEAAPPQRHKALRRQAETRRHHGGIESEFHGNRR